MVRASLAAYDFLSCLRGSERNPLVVSVGTSFLSCLRGIVLSAVMLVDSITVSKLPARQRTELRSGIDPVRFSKLPARQRTVRGCRYWAIQFSKLPARQRTTFGGGDQ